MFNSELTIERAIQSCLDQTWPCFEVLVVDDCSLDRSCQLVEAFRDERVRLLRQGEHLGPADARNLALDAASGDWITFLDADDYYLPDRLERLLQAVEGAPRFTAVTDRFADRGVRRDHAPQVFALEDLVPTRVDGQLMFSRHHLEFSRARFPSGVYNGEDTAFALILMTAPGSRLLRIPDRLYSYSRTEGSLSTQPDKFREVALALRYVLERDDLPDKVRSRIEEAIDQLELEHAYEQAQLLLGTGHFRAFVDMWRRHPQVIPMAIRRAPKAMILRWRRRQRRSHEDGA